MYVVQTFIFKPLKRSPHSPPNFANKISKKIAQSKEKNSFYWTVNILITYCRNVKWKLKDTSSL